MALSFVVALVVWAAEAVFVVVAAWAIDAGFA